MSDRDEIKTPRDKATETLFTFDERAAKADDASVSDDLATVNYDEEVSLQNIFLDKAEIGFEGDLKTPAGPDNGGASAAEEGAPGAVDALSVQPASELGTESGASSPVSNSADAKSVTDASLDGSDTRASVSNVQIDETQLGAATAPGPVSAFDPGAVPQTALEAEPAALQAEPGEVETTFVAQAANRAPVIEGASAESAVEGEAVINGVLVATDPDSGDELAFSLGSGFTAPDGFALNSDGSYSFDPAVASYEHLGPGDSMVLTIPVTVTDSSGATGKSSISVTVTGTNDSPVAGAEIVHSVEEGAATISGQLAASDIDQNAALAFSIAEGFVAPAGFSLTDEGIYTFDPAVADYEALGAGEQVTLSVPVIVSDEHGATDTTMIQLTVTGTNDVPVAGATVFADAIEGGSVVDGSLAATDVDSGTTLQYSIVEGVFAPPGFSLDGDGSFRFDPANPAYDNLGEGDATVLTVPVTITDEHGATDTTSIQITLTGTNDAPVASTVSVSVAEGATPVIGAVNAVDADSGDSLTYAVDDSVAVPDGFILHPDGRFSFDPSDEAYDHLNVGDSVTLTVPITVSDEHGATDTSQIQIKVVGTNDAPVASEHKFVAREGGEIVKGQLPAGDVDSGATLTFSADSELPPGFMLNEDGSYAFNPADPAYDGYGEGEHSTQTVRFTVSDEHGASSEGTLYIGVEGTNDKVSMVVDSDPGDNTVPENSPVGTPVGLVVQATDVDGDAVKYSIVDENGVAVTDGPFAVDAHSGVVTVSDPAQLDYETSTAHEVIVQATSADGSSTQENFRVEVSDVNENRGPQANDDTGRIWVSESTREIVENLRVGSFDGERVEVSDWGELVDGKAVFKEGDITVTTSVSEGYLKAYNGHGHVGFGIGNEDNYGLDLTETLTVELEGGDANRVDFTLSGLGGWFDESSAYATEVQITAYGHDGNIIETQGGYRESGKYDDVYSFETETPVQRFEITSVDSKGTFVVQNMTLTATETIVTPGHWVNVKEDGAITIDVLKNDTDPEGDALSIVGVDSSVVIDGVEVGMAELVEVNGGQHIRFTPGKALESLSEGESQKVSFEYTVSDGQGGTDTARVNLVVEGVDNPPQGKSEAIHGGRGDDVFIGESGNDQAWGYDGNDTYMMAAEGGVDYFHGGAGEGWTDTIQLKADPADGDNPWQIVVEGEQVEYDLAAGALDLQPDTSGVIKLADGSELTFEGVESIQW